MKTLLVAALLITSNVSVRDDTLTKPFKWRATRMVDDKTKLRSSVFKFGHRRAQKAYRIISKTKSLWMKFEGRKCDPGYLEIRLLTRKQINNPEHFRPSPDDHKDGEYFGRYFRGASIMYITYNGLMNNSVHFAHEYAHHMYWACKVFFVNDDIEHERIYDFEQYYLRNIK